MKFYFCEELGEPPSVQEQRRHHNLPGRWVVDRKWPRSISPPAACVRATILDSAMGNRPVREPPIVGRNPVPVVPLRRTCLQKPGGTRTRRNIIQWVGSPDAMSEVINPTCASRRRRRCVTVTTHRT